MLDCSHMKRPVIILFGFSGSGKSTMAKLIGRRLGLRIIHPSGILRDLMRGKKPDLAKTKSNRGFWEGKDGFSLLKGRLDDAVPMDVVSDRILLREIKKGSVVMDSWSMPWLSPVGFKVYLKAPFATRVARVARRGGLSEADARRIVRAKDADTRRLFQRVYGFDIARDHGVFDLVIDTNRMTKPEVLARLLAEPVLVDAKGKQGRAGNG